VGCDFADRWEGDTCGFPAAKSAAKTDNHSGRPIRALMRGSCRIKCSIKQLRFPAGCCGVVIRAESGQRLPRRRERCSLRIRGGRAVERHKYWRLEQVHQKPVRSCGRTAKSGVTRDSPARIVGRQSCDTRAGGSESSQGQSGQLCLGKLRALGLSPWDLAVTASLSVGELGTPCRSRAGHSKREACLCASRIRIVAT
jgi:hypothetical protein